MSHIESGRGTCVYLLGAGASYASPAPAVRLPMQRGFFAQVTRGMFGPLLVEIRHILSQQPMANWLVLHGYGDPDRPYFNLGKDMDLNLEDLYAELEDDPGLDHLSRAACLTLLDRAVFRAVSMPTETMRNHPDRACPYHRALAEGVVPGDTIISFNYDCLADDALLAFCSHWHPLTGYALRFDAVVGGTLLGKENVFNSRVQLLKPHGSVTFRYRENLRAPMPSFMYVGLVEGIQPLHMPIAGEWEYFIVAPSRSKRDHRGFMERQLAQARRAIEDASRLVVIGYSFPQNDQHVLNLFRGFDGEIIIVNPDHATQEYRARLDAAGLFPARCYTSFEDYLPSVGNGL